MEKFHLEFPSIKRKDEALEYLDEHIKFNSKMHGSGGLNRCNKSMTYEQWLEDVNNMLNEEYANSLGYVPGYTYFLIREEDNKIIGMVNIRYNLTEEMLKSAGHIGYGIRPTERGKGYAKIQLYLALQKSKELNLDRVMVACEETNTASDKTIKALNGMFEEKIFEAGKNRTLNIYWINVDETLEMYKDVYLKGSPIK